MATTTTDRWGRVRDTQRQRVYDAERYALDRIDQKMMSLGECQRYVNRLCSKAYVEKRWKNLRPPTILDGRGSPKARYVHWNNTIQLPTWARTRWVILHEMAHYLSERCIEGCGGPQGQVRWCGYEAHHGWHFASIFLLLVRREMGVKAHDDLLQAFGKFRVQYVRPFRPTN